jgi:uncharacterized protein
MSFFLSSVVELRKMLANLDAWLEKGVAHSQAKIFDPDLLLGFRLAPDQYPLLRQIQSSCDSAKFAAARLSGKEAPKHPDTEKTMHEARGRIRACQAYLETFQESDFAGADSCLVELPFLEGRVLSGVDYLTEMALPNFYFHVTTAYAILRHNGVPLGKMDYIGSLNVRDK